MMPTAKFPLVVFEDQEGPNIVVLVWHPGWRSRPFDHDFIEEIIEPLRDAQRVRYDQVILPAVVVIRATGLRKAIIKKIVELRGLKVISKRPGLPRIPWAPVRLRDGRWVKE